VVRARFSARGKLMGTPELRFFVDVLDKDDEARTTKAMVKAADGQWELAMDPRAAGSIVRYQVWGDRGKGPEQISPRPSDPSQWHAYYVQRPITTSTPGTRVYELFVDTAKWQELYTNLAPVVVPATATSPATLQPRRVLPDKCTVNPKWNATVPATFVHNGLVYDVRVRYAGSGFNRLRGLNHPTFAGPKPRDPAPFRVLTWKVKFPRYRSFEGRRGFKLNKLNQSCPGISEAAAGRIMSAAGVPGSAARYARIYINGAYYHYMMEVEETQEEVLERHQPKGAGPVGDLFKADGHFEGPFARTDFSQLLDSTTCRYTAAERYTWNYSRETWDWKGPSREMQTLIDGFTAARMAGAGPLKTFLDAQFDVPQVLTYIAVRNWLGAWDDGYHNYFVYRPAGGKWQMLGTDHDGEMGLLAGYTMVPATASFYIGEAGDPNNLRSGVHLLKDAILKTYRTQFNQRLLELDRTVLSPAAAGKIVDDATALFSIADWSASMAAKPDQINCTDPAALMRSARQWVQARHDQLIKVIR
jgi:hypothetical protein